MVPLCSLNPFVSVRVQGFWFPLLTTPFGHFPFILHFSFPLTHQSPLLSPTAPIFFPMSSSIANSALSALVASPIPSIFNEAILNEGFDHVRDQTPNGYMANGTWFSESEPTYMQVWG